ncbi:hypothetical protein DFH29DRAFT_971816, partial [Suillus ampliporus]
MDILVTHSTIGIQYSLPGPVGTSIVPIVIAAIVIIAVIVIIPVIVIVAIIAVISLVALVIVTTIV